MRPSSLACVYCPAVSTLGDVATVPPVNTRAVPRRPSSRVPPWRCDSPTVPAEISGRERLGLRPLSASVTSPATPGGAMAGRVSQIQRGLCCFCTRDSGSVVYAQ